MAPSLLIVVPTLNSHNLLPRLLTSLQQQTWAHWQLLFIDGPSGPEHRQWLQQCCAAEHRCRWMSQDPCEPGIFGAMNHGFAAAADPSSPADWLLFWGSDDWAASATVLAEAMADLETSETSGTELRDGWPDLLVCRGRYANAAQNSLGRIAAFQPPGLLTRAAYRRALLLGSTPPHQATLFGPGARRRLAHFAPGFRLSADLDYFLQLSNYPGLRVQCLNLELVHMDAGGISGQQTQRRLKEVRNAYRRAFGWIWWFPFLNRYIRRLATLLERNR
jgi:glycosyltransferase involved in cell wall biosynthesis